MKLDKIGTESVEILKSANTFVDIGREKALEGMELKHDIGKELADNLRRWGGFGWNPYPENQIGKIGTPPYFPKYDFAKEINAYDIARKMFDGEGKSLGLKDINGWKRNLEYYDAQLRQQAGYAAEVIGTAKDNLAAQLEKTGLTTHRTDDLLGEFKKNDSLIDKVRKNEAGQIVERIQVKFIGSDGRQLLKKLASPKFGKYFDSKVDKIEIPSDYYDEIFSNNLIKEEISGLERQLEHAKQAGKTDVAAGIQSRIDRFQKIEKSLLRSRVSSSEARQAVIYPKTYIARLFAKDIALGGLKQGALAGLATAAVSTVENTKKVMDGEITPMEAFGDVAKKTAVAGGIGTGIGFISEAAALTMSGSSHTLIRSMANLGIPALIVTVGIDSFDAIIDYSRGTIDGKDLAYNLGHSTAKVTGAATGMALGTKVGIVAGGAVGAAVGTVITPGAGTLIGMKVGAEAGAVVGAVVGGLVGTAVASEAYKTMIEIGSSEQAKVLLDKTKELATSTINQLKQMDKAELVAGAAGAVIGTAAGVLAAPVIGAAVGAAGGAAGYVIGKKAYRAAQKFFDTPNKAEAVQKEFNDYFKKTGIPITV